MSVPSSALGTVEEQLPLRDGVFAPGRRRLTVGLVLTITLVAFESLAIATVMPTVQEDLGGLALYGWVFSGFFLASLVGIVVTGVLSDRRGPAVPFTAGLVLFGAGLVAGGLATSMGMLVAARIAQGFGAGTIPAAAYAAIALGYPAELRPRVFAVNSTAWVLPGILGPSLATLIEHAASWHWVFLGLLPLVVVAAIMAIPALTRLRPEAPPDGRGLSPADRTRLVRVGLLVLGVGAVFAATSVDVVLVGIALAVVGLPVAVWAFVRLVPAGTVRLERGLPSVVGVRGLLTWAFFGCDAYVSLAVTEGLGGSTLLAGLVLTATSITWTAGSWVQERWIKRVGPRRLDVIGFALVAAGTAAMLVVATGLPPWTAIPAWAIGGLGMGLAYSPLSVAALACAPTGQTGAATASLQLSDTLGISIGTGIGGAAVALADGQGWTVATGVGIAFTVSLLLAVIGFVAARRIPARLPADPAG